MKLLKLNAPYSSILSSLLLALLCSSCATIFGNENRGVHIDTIPHGASIYVNDTYYSKTPGKILLASTNYSPSEITIKKEGYYDKHIFIHTRFQHVGYWNFLCPLGFLVDHLAGTSFQFEPKDLNQKIYLTPYESTPNSITKIH